MINRRIICLLMIFHVLPSGKSTSQRFLSKLVNEIQTPNKPKKYKAMDGTPAELNCKYKCITTNEPASRFQARFIDLTGNDSVKDSEMEAPASKFSIFNLLNEDEDDGEKLKREDDDEEEEEEGNAEGEDEEEEEGDYSDNDIDFNFFNPDEETDVNPGTKDENLKQHTRRPLRMHNLIFPLLLAYKLKFFTVIPLLLGSLVLLIGTTGIAGFFFALFAAALGIHVKNQQN